MKKVIDLEGNEKEVSDETIVRTTPVGHFLLTQVELDQIAINEINEIARKADYIANHKYKDDRKKAYGSIEDQLDMIYWDKKNSTNTFIDHINIVKENYPKPI